MGRVTFHLLGSFVLAALLLGIAELAGRSELQASAPRASIVKVESTSTAPQKSVRTGEPSALYSRCWELVGFNSTWAIPRASSPNRTPLAAQPLPVYLMYR